jgi:hypothetical protein
MRHHNLPYVPPVYDASTGRLTEQGDLYAAPTGGGKSHALAASCEAAINTIAEHGLKARVVLYCSLDRIRTVPDGAILLDGKVDAAVWDADPLYVVVRPGRGEDGRPAVTMRHLFGMARPDAPTLVYVDEGGLGTMALKPKEKAELEAILIAGRGGLPELGVGPVVLRTAAQRPAQLPPAVRDVALHRKFFGRYGDDLTGVPAARHLPHEGSPWGTFYAPGQGLVQLCMKYDKELLHLDHGADWGAKKAPAR